MPKQQRRQALTSALSLKASGEAVTLIEPLALDAPSTRRVAEALKSLGLARKRVLLVLDRPDEAVVKSCRNIPNLRTTLAHKVHPYELMDCDVLLTTQAGIDRLKEVFVR